jgi:hypothetical protein
MMAIAVPAELVEFVLLGPLDDRRQLQDSPILGDVWVAFGENPNAALELLIAPYRGQNAGIVAAAIDAGVGPKEDPKISYLQGIVAARLTFSQLMRVVVPKTKWWLKNNKWEEGTLPRAPKKQGSRQWSPPSEPVHFLSAYTTETLEPLLRDIFDSARDWREKAKNYSPSRELPALDRFMAITGLILWAATIDPEPGSGSPRRPADPIDDILNRAKPEPKLVTELLMKLKASMLETPLDEPLVWQVWLNRRPVLALTRSVPAVKADAARTLFKVDCSHIAWAVLDSGIDGTHPAFRTEDGIEPRIRRSFDFKDFRKIVSLSNRRPKQRANNEKELLGNKALLQLPFTPNSDLQRLAEDALSRGPIRWDLVERFVEIKPDSKPPVGHGTHVAGIIGASKAAASASAGRTSEDFADGMCPDISLFDFRVLARTPEDTEFAIIAALQFIRYLNQRDNHPTIHGANLSLSIAHDVRNFACGRTPICDECERLVESGVVVVTAAGNHGYKSFQTKDGSYDSYAAFSITDPGNSDCVLTVGATHRFWPHTYGISFFSSRGPTGDGRLKPDLVAPGERIRAPLPGGEWGDLDGTSMAAPHVSGAAAMLMARYSELIGHPRRIKQILCDSATDLGRERSFQGRGMLDVLRAFQSI